MKVSMPLARDDWDERLAYGLSAGVAGLGVLMVTGIRSPFFDVPALVGGDLTVRKLKVEVDDLRAALRGISGVYVVSCPGFDPEHGPGSDAEPVRGLLIRQPFLLYGFEPFLVFLLSLEGLVSGGIVVLALG